MEIYIISYHVYQEGGRKNVPRENQKHELNI